MNKLITPILVLSLSACASIQSIQNPRVKNSDGLTYFLPKKDFKITAKVNNGKVTEISIGTTASYPDLSEQFVLKHGRNWIAKSDSNLKVNTNGLLGSASASITDITSTFSMLGGLKKLSKTTQPKASQCADGSHTKIFDITKAINKSEDGPCGLEVLIKAHPEISFKSTLRSKENKEGKEGEVQSGVFYRINRGYLVEVRSGNSLLEAQIVFSPSGSPTLFLPVARTFLADNKSELTFVDGVPETTRQTIDSEIGALLSLPATVLKGYFEAIGGVFDNLKASNEKEKNALNTELQLALTRQKVEMCLQALQTGNSDLITQLNCGGN